MPRCVYYYTRAGLRTVNVADEDHNDCPPYNLKDVNWPVPDEVEDDTRAGNCTPSDDIIARMRRDSKESGAFAFITLARAHIGGLAFSEYGFPGYERREKLLARAIARTSTFLGGAKRELCDDGGEVTARTKELASFGDQRSPLIILTVDEGYRRLVNAAESVLRKHYGVGDVSPSSERAIEALVEDNYLFKVWSPDGQSRTEPFRNPAIAKVFGEAFIGHEFTDLYGSKIYFEPKVPSTMIVLICAAIRAALDGHAPKTYIQRDFTREQYGPILADLSYRWDQLDVKYAADTQHQLTQTIKLAKRKRSLFVPGMQPNMGIPALADLYKYVGSA